MKLLRVISIIGIILGVAVILPSLYLILLNDPSSAQIITTYNQQDSNVEENDNEPVITKNNISQKDTLPVKKEYILEESGWIPYWAFDLGIESLKNNLSIIKSVSPVLYSINSNGALQKNSIQALSLTNGIRYIKENNIKLIPTVSSNNFNNTNILFSNESVYKKNIDDILNEIDINDYDGVDLDYESIHTKHKDSFITYLKLLSEQLHKKGKILSVTVFTQWENAKYLDHIETRVVQDYATISQLADEVRIMAYDYTSPQSKTAGPIGPITWIRDTLEYALKYFSKEKIVLGVHLYSYEWQDSKVSALTNTTVANMLNKGIAREYKEDIAEGYATYGCSNGLKCEMYYQTKEGIKQRREIAKEFGIKGISYWRLGGELDILK